MQLQLFHFPHLSTGFDFLSGEGQALSAGARRPHFVLAVLCLYGIGLLWLGVPGHQYCILLPGTPKTASCLCDWCHGWCDLDCIWIMNSIAYSIWYHMIQVISSRASRERKFQKWYVYSVQSGAKTVPIGCGQAFCASQQQSLVFLFQCHLFWRLIFSHFIWSHRVAVSLGNWSFHPIVTAVCVIPSHLMSCFFSVFHLASSPLISSYLISSHPLLSSHVFSPFRSSSQLITTCIIRVFSSLLSSSELFSFQLFSASPFYAARLNSALSSSPLFSCQVVSTHPISSQLISALLRFSQLFLQLFSALGSSCQLISCLLISSLIFSHPLSSS